MKFRVHIVPNEEGVFVTERPILSGCISQDVTREKAIQNIHDAVASCLFNPLSQTYAD
jgi:predicted RNase H-like HicB family nuclease